MQVTMIYSFLYTTKYFNIFEGKEIGWIAILKTLGIFTSWSINNKNICSIQSFLVIKQIFTFVIMFAFFIGNIFNFKYKDEI